MAEVTVIDHPLIQHKLTLMRKKETPSASFRRLLHEIGGLLAYEATRDAPLSEIEIQTPLEKMKSPAMQGKKMVIVSILRAGNGLVDGMLELIPSARISHIGLYRDPKTLEAVEYYFKVPENMSERDTIVADPMLATGHTASAALSRLKEVNPKSIKFACLLAAPEGIKHLQEKHPDVAIFTCAIDRELSEKAYILPGLGDAGDRIYGTK